MKLLELNPSWCTAVKGRHGMGLSFECPIHRFHRLAVMFANPVDGGECCKDSKYVWQRTGETWDDLTLGPSIDASGNVATIGEHAGMIQTPCWHGFIRNGAVE
jgi:hypothetical protein